MCTSSRQSLSTKPSLRPHHQRRWLKCDGGETGHMNKAGDTKIQVAGHFYYMWTLFWVCYLILSPSPGFFVVAVVAIPFKFIHKTVQWKTLSNDNQLQCHLSFVIILDLLLQLWWCPPQDKNIRKLILVKWNRSLKSSSKSKKVFFNAKMKYVCFDKYIFSFQLNNIHIIA